MRSHPGKPKSLSARRAWIEIFRPPPQVKPVRSLSARRAWIEIRLVDMSAAWNRVALRKESVDRNFYYADKDADWVRSLSARRAWIEIESSIKEVSKYVGRSPQGERG